ncbi:unnamed protein product [Orchesella dallaii]|uniref:Uncharacterized protein n=1 Tax=Orchesella dallaii TaxID=48710 RepID=A0ABP1R2E4_9HEXA
MRLDLMETGSEWTQETRSPLSQEGASSIDAPHGWSTDRLGSPVQALQQQMRVSAVEGRDDGGTIEEFLKARVAAAKKNLEGVGTTLLEKVNDGEATEFIVENSTSGAIGSLEKCDSELV